jgi:hypothetical protein
MRLRLHVVVVSVLALGMVNALGAFASSQPGQVTVQVQRDRSVSGTVHVRFRPTVALPAGGYYYAVIVLKPYKGYTRTAPPPCAVSSDMQKTAYGYPHPGQAVSLTLTRTASRQHRWCRGGTYVGAIYAVPNPPPCQGKYPCSSEYSEASPCWEAERGHRVCGALPIRSPTHIRPACRHRWRRRPASSATSTSPSSACAQGGDGGGRIRTSEGRANAFTAHPL